MSPPAPPHPRLGRSQLSAKFVPEIVPESGISCNYKVGAINAMYVIETLASIFVVISPAEKLLENRRKNGKKNEDDHRPRTTDLSMPLEK